MTTNDLNRESVFVFLNNKKIKNTKRMRRKRDVISFRHTHSSVDCCDVTLNDSCGLHTIKWKKHAMHIKSANMFVFCFFM